MNYIALSILYIIFLNKNIEILASFLTISLIVFFFFIKKNELQFYLESNITYNDNLELIYLLSNITINSIFFIQLLYIIFIVYTINQYTVNIQKLTKYNEFFIENIIFYTLYTYNINYIIKKEYLFLLHENILSLIHPILTVSTFIYFLIYLKKNNIINVYYKILFSTLLGIVWAITTEGWGGAWVWDPTEVMLLHLTILLIIVLHKKKEWKGTFLLYWVSINLVYYVHLNKLSLVSGIHNFYLNNITTSIYYQYLIVLILVSILLTIIKNDWIINIIINKYILIMIMLILAIFFIRNIEIDQCFIVYNILFIKVILFILSIAMILSTLQLFKKRMNVLLNVVFVILIYISLQIVHFYIFLILYLLYLITTLIIINTWTLKNHVIHLILLTIIVINYVEFENNSSKFINTFFNSIPTVLSSNDYLLQNKNISHTYNIKYYLNTNYYFLESNIHKQITFEQIKNIIYQIKTNLISIISITESRTFEELIPNTFLYIELNLFINKYILLLYWAILISYTQTKW